MILGGQLPGKVDGRRNLILTIAMRLNILWVSRPRKKDATAKRWIVFIILLSSAVEHSAVNRRVVGSSPTGGVSFLVRWSRG